MASIINASTTSTSGLVYSADASGVLQLQSNGVTGVSIQSGGKVVLPSTMLSTASAGQFEYDGRVPYFTPLDTQRGVVPGMQLYVLGNAVTGLNATGAQSILGVGVTLSSNTVYAFEGVYALSKTAGTTNHSVAYGFGGTATLNSISYIRTWGWSSSGFATWTSGIGNLCPYFFVQTAATTAGTGESTNTATAYWTTHLKGIVSINAGGTFIPQYSLSAAPGGAYTKAAGSYFQIYPIGESGSNISVGTWA